jgi:hypothetical protein
VRAQQDDPVWRPAQMNESITLVTALA